MLYLYQSNKLEYLADTLITLQQAQPLSNPMAAEEIIVQSQGMRRYITQYLAQKQSIAANLRFSLPAGLNWQLTRKLLPNTPPLNPFASEVMQWRLFELFQSVEFKTENRFQPAFEALKSYLQAGDYAAYQLSAQLADVFDQYLVYRPDWLSAWSSGQRVEKLDKKSQAEQTWQMILWQFLDNGLAQTPHRAQLWVDLMHALENPKIKLPERFFVFGIATIAPMYLTLLKQLAKHSDVHILALNPSAAYWGNIIEPAQILNENNDLDLTQQGHPLLASLGKQGRDFFNELTEAEAKLELEIFDEESHFSGSLLHQIQYQIQSQTLPENARKNENFIEKHKNFVQTKNNIKNIDENPIAQIIADNSIQVHSAHSPLRELQILKDRLLQLLHDNPTWQPDDIAVLTPHVEPYAPFIEAVFGAHNAGVALPFHIADIKLSRRQPFLSALEHIFTLLSSRFESDKLLPLLDSELILNKFELKRDDLPLLHETVKQLNIRWGADQNQRAEYGDEHALFTWQQGLERLILGFMLPENAAMWQGIIAHSSRPDHLAVLSQFADLVRILSQLRQKWQQPATVAQWCERVRELPQLLLHTQADDHDAIFQWEQALADWTAETELANFQAAIGAEVALAHIKRFLNMPTEAGFLRGGITFCSMIPMRSLPFKVLCLIGLNDGEFPRTAKASHFDLIAKYPQKGDRARRDDDRYLFLEAILSAREILYLSFIGKDIRTDELRAPSALLNEFCDTIAHLFDVSNSDLMKNWLVSHPLQAFSRQYFSGSPNLWSSRQDYAHALNQVIELPKPFINTLPENPSEIAPENVSQKAFIEYWRNPVRAFLRRQLDWQEPQRTRLHASSEPFQTDTPRQLADFYVQARQTGQNFDDLAQQLRAQSLLPSGELGNLLHRDYAIKAKQIDSNLLKSQRKKPRVGELKMRSGSLNYHLNHNHEAGQIIFSHQLLHERNEHGRLYAADKIEILLRHLIYCATEPEVAETHFITLDETLTLPEIKRDIAENALSDWLAVYHQGQNAPLPFFPRVNLKAAETLFKNQKDDPDVAWQKATAEAAKLYHTGYTSRGQESYPEVQLVYRHQDDDDLPYKSKLFRQITESLFAPLAGCLNAFKAEK